MDWTMPHGQRRQWRHRMVRATQIATLCVLSLMYATPPSYSQTTDRYQGAPPTRGRMAQPSAEELANTALADNTAASLPTAEGQSELTASVPLLDLLLRGGWLIAPIVLMSFVVGAVAVERWYGLQRRRVAPRKLHRGLLDALSRGSLDQATGGELCRLSPSSSGRVVQAMLAKLGRPHPEVEAAAAEATQREADRLYANVRTLNLAAAVTPLLGLMGTVWGMIQSFFATANMPLGSNKAQALAEGIYVALVTTFAGLAVAIPAAVLAHYFEGRILRLIRRIEELTADLLPSFERYEGMPRASGSDASAYARRPIPTSNPGPHISLDGSSPSIAGASLPGSPLTD